MSRLFTITFLLCLFLQSCKNKTPSLDQVVKEMSDYKMFESKFVGLTQDSSPQWGRYETLLAASTLPDLVQLCENESPVVRSYAFQGLVEKSSPQVFEVLVKHIQDTGEFDRIMGCMVDPCYVSDFYLERVGYFPYDTSGYKITLQQKEYIDSLILFGSAIILRQNNYNRIRLRSRAQMLKNLPQKSIYYNRLKQIVLEGVIEALPALAKFQNSSDVSIIRNLYKKEGLIGEEYVFEAITYFPHPDLFDLVEEAVLNDLHHDNYFDGYNYKFFQALVQYKTQRAKELLAKTISTKGGENQKKRVEKVKYLISKNPHKLFDDLLK